MIPRSFTTRLTLALALLLLAYGVLVGLLGRHVADQHAEESLQRLSQGLARNIVEHWPEIARTASNPDQAERDARAALLSMLMVVNPGVQVYVLDAQGTVDAYIGDPGMVQQPQVDLDAVRAFLSGAALPLLGTDPMLQPGTGAYRIFSAAMFSPRSGDLRPPGYLYVVLDSPARARAAGPWNLERVWRSAALVALLGLLVTLIVGSFAFSRLSQPLHRLAQRIGAYRMQADPEPEPALVQVPSRNGDEVAAIGGAFDTMTARLETQAAREAEQARAHRETLAGLAHDLRTPLTALHGHLEALSEPASHSAERPDRHQRVLSAALAQSDKVRRLSQQLFELAALQSSDQVLQRERFSLDELVTDAVRKFELRSPAPPVTLVGEAPGRLVLDGDLQLVERALTNLIDNALRHAGGPVKVSLRRENGHAQVLVEDGGPGLPAELLLRLEQGRSLRDPPLPRATPAAETCPDTNSPDRSSYATTGPNGRRGGIGGLGLAIAQRVAVLHGGSLLPLPAPQGGTRLCLALPLAV